MRIQRGFGGVGAFAIIAALSVSLILTVFGQKAGHSEVNYPVKPIQLIVPFEPGGAIDLVGRSLAGELSQRWNLPVTVVNKAGGGTIPGTNFVMMSAPDGYTMLQDSVGTCSGQVYKKELPYKIEARTFVAILSIGPCGFMVPSTTPYRSLSDLVAEYKKDPGKVSWSSHGTGSGPDTIARQFFKVIGVDAAKTTAVVFPGTSQALIAVAGGHVGLVIAGPKPMLPLVQAGKARILAVQSAERLEWLPDVPTTKEAGLAAVNYHSWLGITGPPGLPDYVINKWAKTMEELTKDPGFVAKYIERTGQVISYAGPSAFKKAVVDEMNLIRELFPGQ